MELTKKRQTNFELLRVISMLLLVAHHFCVHSGILQTDSPYKLLAFYFYPVGKICFVSFMCISMWFFVDQKFNTRRFFRIWLEVFCYSILFYFVYFIFKEQKSLITFIRELLSCMLPIGGNVHGFAASYLLFYLLFPFLKQGLDLLSKNKLKILLSIVFYAQVIEQVINKFTYYNQPIYSEIQLFVLIFIFIYYVKKYPIEILDNKLINVFILFVVYAIVFIPNYYTYFITDNKYISFISSFTVDESSLLYILAGVNLFFLFKSSNIPYNGFINKIATTTFGILLIHDHNYFRTTLWKDILQVNDWLFSNYFVLYFLLSIFCIYICCVLIDFLRQVLEKKIIKLRIFSMLEHIENRIKRG